MFENPRRGRQARNFTTNVPKILVLKSSSEQIFSRKLPLGAPVKYKLSIIFRAKNYLCISQSWLLVTKAKTLRPLRRKIVFCSFVFIIRDFISKGLNPERDAYVLCFRRVLSSGTKNNNNKRHLLYFSRMARQRAFRQRNRRRVCAWPL